MIYRISIAFASDNNYAQHMAVSIASLLKNASAGFPIDIYILHENLSVGHIDKIFHLRTLRPETQIHFLQISLDDFKDFPLHTGLHSIATYFRLKLPSLLPEVDRILYLDSDIVVCGDIADMWRSYPCKDKLLGAVEEPKSLNAKRLTVLGMKEDSPYFNGGILDMNLKKMRDTQFEAKSISYISRYKDVIRYQDQDVLNALAEGDWRALPLRFNSFFFVLEGIYKNDFRIYTAADIQQARQNPFIIHFNQHPKPWGEGCIDPRRKDYFKYIDLTPYKGFRVDQSKSWQPILKEKLRNSVFYLNTHAPFLYRVLRSIKRKVVGYGHS